MNVNKLGAFQGDVVIHRIDVDAIPSDAKPTQNRIVAYGEATGHHHVIEGECDVLENLFGFVVKVAEPNTAKLVHIGNEHETIEITPGIYWIPREAQVEYDGEEERRVCD